MEWNEGRSGSAPGLSRPEGGKGARRLRLTNPCTFQTTVGKEPEKKLRLDFPD